MDVNKLFINDKGIMSTAPLETFIKKYQTAKNYNSKEIRLTLHEAEEISTAIALLLSNTANLSNKIIELQDRIINLTTDQEIIASGGSF